MSNVFRFPAARSRGAQLIPREEFERLAELALDIVDRIVALLDSHDGDHEAEDGSDAEPSLGAPKLPGDSQVIWFRGNESDGEQELPSRK